MSSTGETLSFSTEEQVMLNGEMLNYSLYDKDKIVISHPTLGLILNAKYVVKNKTLTLTSLDDETVFVFYGDEDRQNSIRTEMEKIKEDYARQEEENKKNEEYASYVNSLWQSYDHLIWQIENCQNNIDNHVTSIELKEADLEMYKSTGTLTSDRLEDIRARQEEHRIEIEILKQEKLELENQLSLITEELKKLGEISD